MNNQRVRIDSATPVFPGEGAWNPAPVGLILRWLRSLPRIVSSLFGSSRVGRFGAIFVPPVLLIALAFVAIASRYVAEAPKVSAAVSLALALAFCTVTVVTAFAAWMLMLAQERHRLSRQRSELHTQMLMREIEAHEKTDAQ